MKNFTPALLLIIGLWIAPAFLTAGETLPFIYDFSGTGFPETWTVLDQNNDGTTWTQKNGEGVYNYHRTNKADDWLVTPAFSLEAGKTYRFGFDIKTYSSSTEENLKVMLGSAPQPESLTVTLLDLPGYKNNKYATKEILIAPDRSGTYYIGFYAYSDPNKWYIYLDNIRFEEVVSLPAPITDLTVQSGSEGSLKAVLNWTNPDKDQLGNALEELTAIDIYRDEQLIHTIVESLTPGEKGQWTDREITAPGKYRYRIIPRNQAGETPGETPVVTSPWIGEDTPAAVTEIVLSSENYTVSLSFLPPQTGENGGWINTAELYYRIVRQPGEHLLEEHYTGSMPYVDQVPDLDRYCYEITPYTQAGAGIQAVSDKIIAGRSRSLPYTTGFDTENEFQLFSVIDNDQDGRTWEYDKQIQAAKYTAGTMADDWLISPAFALEAGKSYKLAFDAKSYNYTNSKRLRVTLGTLPTVEAQDSILMDTLIDYAYYHTHELLFFVRESGTYHIGFQCYDDPKMLELWIDNISLQEIFTLPAAPERLAIVPGEQGDLSATVNWINSDRSQSGAPLSSLSKVEVYRNDTLIYTEQQPVAGTAGSYTDSTVPQAGIYTYRIVCSTEDGPGAPATQESPWIGADIPLPVTDLLLVDEEGMAKITFEAPAGGENGGWIDREKMSYTIRRQPGDVLLTDSLTITAYIDTAEKPLATYTYTVTAITPAGSSAPAETNAVVFGDALGVPYTMNFTPEEDEGIWTIADANQDGKTWQYNKRESRMEYTSYSVPDDWLFTPPFRLTPGNYMLETNVRTGAMRDTYKEQLKITLGQSSDPENQTTLITDTTFAALVGTNIQRTFTVPAEGNWYIGFHLYSSDPWGFYMNNFELRKSGNVGIGTLKSDLSGLYYEKSSRRLILTDRNITHIRITAMTGQTVLTVERPSQAIGLENLPAGVYIVRYETTDGKNGKTKILKY